MSEKIIIIIINNNNDNTIINITTLPLNFWENQIMNYQYVLRDTNSWKVPVKTRQHS